MQVYSYSSDSQVVNGLISRYPEINWVQLQQATEINALKDDGLILILRSPVKVGSILVSPEQTWKKYLAEQAPNCKFIIAGFAEAQHRNYLDLLNLPNDFAGFVHHALTVAQDWEPINTGASDMSKKLDNFFSGHGKDSIVDILSKINVPLKMALDKYHRQEPKNFGKLASDFLFGLTDNWLDFERRWQRYFFLFHCLPYFDLFEKCNILIERLRANFDPIFFSTWGFEELESTRKHLIDLEILLNKAKKYV